MPERHPGWVTGINDFEARLATGLLVGSQETTGALDPLRVRSGLRDAPGNPGLVTLGVNKATVNPFQAVIQDGARPALGPYLVTLDEPKELALTAADPSLGRIDLVIAEVDPNVEPGFVVRLVQGERAASPQPPTVTNPLHLKLAQIQVPPSGTAATPTDLRQFTAALGGILPVRGAGDMPPAGAGSLFVYRLDTRVLQVRSGNAWVAYRPPRGSVDTWHEYVFPSTGNWTHYNVSSGTDVYNRVAYTVTEDGWVHLRGLAATKTNSAANATILTLPADYRPRRQILVTIMTANGPSRADIRTSGVVTVANVLEATDWVSLDNLAFPAANTYPS